MNRVSRGWVVLWQVSTVGIFMDVLSLADIKNPYLIAMMELHDCFRGVGCR